MTIPTIGSFAFVGWGAQLRVGGYSYRKFEQAGLPGYGVVFGALKTDEQVVPTLYRASSEANALTTLSGYRALMATSVTIIDPLNIAWANSLILGVEGVVSNDAIGYYLRAAWKVLLVSA